MLIEELVSMDLQGDFRSDVQLSDYEESYTQQGITQEVHIHCPRSSNGRCRPAQLGCQRCAGYAQDRPHGRAI